MNDLNRRELLKRLTALAVSLVVPKSLSAFPELESPTDIIAGSVSDDVVTRITLDFALKNPFYVITNIEKDGTIIITDAGELYEKSETWK